MKAQTRWAVALLLGVLFAATALQASASTYLFTYETLDSPYFVSDDTTFYGAPAWWNFADENTLSLQLTPSPNPSTDEYYGYGIAPTWWIPESNPVEGNTYKSTGWTWERVTTAPYNYTKLWLQNRANVDAVKEIFVWWKPAGMTNPSSIYNSVLLDSEGVSGAKADVFAYDSETGAAFAKWTVDPQPGWETITWNSCSHPECDVYVGVRCAPGLPAFALVGVAPVLGMFVRRRRG